MSQTLLEMARDLVAEQIRVHRLSPDDMGSLLLSTHATLLSLQQTEAPSSVVTGSPTDRTTTPESWKGSINKHSVTCLECGATFRQLSSRHLRLHDLDSRAYRTKYGIPSTQPLSSRQATARRRELAHQIRPWEQAASKRMNAKTQGGKATKASRSAAGRAARP